MTRITKVQRAALMKLMDGEWRFWMGAFTRKTLKSLIDRKMIETKKGLSYFRITPAGREALGLLP